jgi:hypothetical protein
MGVETDAVLERDVGSDDAIRADDDVLTDLGRLDDGRLVCAGDRHLEAPSPTHRPAVCRTVECGSR